MVQKTIEMIIDNDIVAKKLANKLFLDYLGFNHYSSDSSLFYVYNDNATYALCYGPTFQFLMCSSSIKEAICELFEAIKTGMTIYVLNATTYKCAVNFNKDSVELKCFLFDCALEGIIL